MKRSKFGLWLLIGLLIVGIVCTWAIIRCNEPIVQMVRQAGDAALREDWETAETRMKEAKDLWERQFPFCAALADHEPMEVINGLFAQLEVYAKSRDPQNFAAVCAQLSQDTKAMGEAHGLNWWNLL